MQYPLFLPHTGYSASHDCLSVRWSKKFNKEGGRGGGEVLISFFVD
jgi:hypothetical protein